ncbi:acyl-CoA dehydrogenase [Cupriavidus basilensis OR16]|uniref:Acyl-CoA dehydrogenase n=1 Tax=Cupriavidus basilensis OR16 TaxID=1127483 RepID=H1SD79_9BURK|nr:acyl-CoA dehydrogenase family protein [Cupriavidus basilensis]EHP39527.1 acyl-CoA dehydrogenase [Cupriavidus basilensis OR16]
MSNFDPDLTDPFVARAVVLREAFHTDAVQRDKAGGRPTEAIRLLKESGLLCAGIPTAYGGGGASWLSVLRVVREFARTDGSLAHLFGYHHLPVHAVQARGTPAQQDRWLRAAAAQQWLWSNSGNALSKTSSAQRAPGNDGWVVTGFRPFSSGSHVADVIQLAWENELGQRLMGVVPANRAGIVIEDDWDGIGQRQTGSGTVTFNSVRVRDDELLGKPDDPLTPFASLTTLLQQSVLLNVFVGTAQGALDEGRAYTATQSRPWIHAGVERHVDDPWVQRKYGELAIRTMAATELADQAARSLDAIYGYGQALTLEQRGPVAIALASANLYAGETGLAVSNEIFEVMGARSATNANGFDRFWRNVRTHTLHNPAEYKKRTVGTWLLTGEFPSPAVYR